MILESVTKSLAQHANEIKCYKFNVGGASFIERAVRCFEQQLNL